MPKMQKQPGIGSIMYHVNAHLYYVPYRADPVMDYCVCSGSVRAFCKRRYVEVVLIGKFPNGSPTPHHYKLADICTKCFYSAADAANLTKQLTENCERMGC